jgi:hypothetical protein
MTWTRTLGAYFCASLLFSQITICQQTSAPPVQPQVLLQKSLAALAGNTTLADITLSGTAERIAGSDDETGSVVLKANSAGALRLDFSYSSGPRMEVRSVTADGVFSGAWSGPDSVSHPIAFHNLVGDWGFVPVFALANILSNQNTVLSYVGLETLDGQSVLHLRSHQQFPSFPSDSANLLQHLSEMDILLDSATLLPVVIRYNAHPDDDALQDIPVEMRFSEYRVISGALFPFRVRKYLNNGLTLDLKFDSVAVNSGVGPDTFSVGAGQ